MNRSSHLSMHTLPTTSQPSKKKKKKKDKQTNKQTNKQTVKRQESGGIVNAASLRSKTLFSLSLTLIQSTPRRHNAAHGGRSPSATPKRRVDAHVRGRGHSRSFLPAAHRRLFAAALASDDEDDDPADSGRRGCQVEIAAGGSVAVDTGTAGAADAGNNSYPAPTPQFATESRRLAGCPVGRSGLGAGASTRG
ncbi:hypothetical protein BKA80DRAFT_112873 [Phyllosticta citrichinensis]